MKTRVQDTRDFFRTRDVRAAQNIYAEIVSRNADDSFQVRLQDTGEIVRATRAVEAQTYDSGDTVILSRPTAVNRNVGHAIIGFPGTALKNTAGVPPTEEAFDQAGQAVDSVTPVIVARGATSSTITIRGVGFAAAPTAPAGLTVNPISVTSTLISCTVTAAIGATVGRYALTVGTQRLENAVTVIP